MTIQDNIRATKQAIEEVERHCMCAILEENRTHFVVYYPAGYFPHGAQIRKGDNKTRALETLLAVMERHWLTL